MKYRFWLGLIALALVIGIVITGAYLYSRAQLPALQSQPAYTSPEEGMRQIILASYIDVQKVEIVRASKGLPFLDNLYFVEARVWADSRIDGWMKYADGDNPGCFFLRLEQGWVLVPESRWPVLIALGLRQGRLE